MENASKALLIAGAALLAMMILGTGIMLYNSYSNTAKQYTNKISINEITKFNSNFEIFEGREDITAQDIVSLINMVDEYNKKTYIDITIKVNAKEYKNGWGSTDTASKTTEFLKNSMDKLYKCAEGSISYDEEGKVKLITFTEKT